jgi:hypothetical protein
VSRRENFGLSVATAATSSRTGICAVIARGFAGIGATTGVTGGSGFFIGGATEIAFVRARRIGASLVTVMAGGMSRFSTDCCGAGARPDAEPSKSTAGAAAPPSGVSTSHGSGFSPNCCFMYAARPPVVVRSWAYVAKASSATRISSAVWNRLAGSWASAFRMIASSAIGMSGRCSRGEGTLPLTIALIVRKSLSALKRRRVVASS